MKKIVTALLAVIMILSCAVFIPSYAADEEGMSFEIDKLYKTENVWSTFPHTYEAEVYFAADTDKSVRGGVILGNYSGDKVCSNFAIQKNGHPRLYFKDGSKTHDYTFDGVSVYTGKWTHLSIVYDINAMSVTCYVDGVAAQILPIENAVSELSYTTPMCLGGDLRGGNEQYFKGLLKSVAVFSDARTADEIAADCGNGVKKDAEGLLAVYRTVPVNGKDPEIISDGMDGQRNMIDPLYSENNGAAFPEDKYYKSEKTYTKMPETFEASFYFPADVSKTQSGGVLLGNFISKGRDALNYEIGENGIPRIYLIDSFGLEYKWEFTGVSVYDYAGEWTHIAITFDSQTKEVKCYINGELKKTLRNRMDTPYVPDDIVVLGADRRSGNKESFKGRISSVALYNDVRTADEIKADALSVDISRDDLMLAYVLDRNSAALPETIKDISGNGYDLTLYNPWFTEKESLKEYAYSFALVGDIQTITYNHPEQLAGIYDWIVENAAAKKMAFVFGLGDITDKDTDDEWVVAKENIKKLDGVVPYSVIRGNHDSRAQFDKYFSATEFSSLAEGTYEGSLTNYYTKLTVGQVKYLIINFDFGPSDEALAWAGGIIEANPDHKVIISTHAYLYRDGSTLDKTETSPPTLRGGYNDGNHIWDKFVRKYENIVLVLCGHDPTDRITVSQTEGDHGNTVTQILVDPQTTDKNYGPTGLVAMMYFSEDGQDVQVEYYSTLRGEYFLTDNQFSLTVDMNTHGQPSEDDTDENEIPTESETISGEGETEPTGDEDKDTDRVPSALLIPIVVTIGILAVLFAIAALIVTYKKKK